MIKDINKRITVKYLENELKKLNIKFEEIEQDADRDHWLMADEALPGAYGKFGLIDEIVGKKK